MSDELEETLDDAIIKNMTQSVEHLRAAEATYRAYWKMAPEIIADGHNSLVEKIREKFSTYKVEHNYVNSNLAYDYIHIYKEGYSLGVALCFYNGAVGGFGVFVKDELTEKLPDSACKALEKKFGTSRVHNLPLRYPWCQELPKPFNNWSWNNIDLVEYFFNNNRQELNEYQVLIDKIKSVLKVLDELYTENPEIFSAFKVNP